MTISRDQFPTRPYPAGLLLRMALVWLVFAAMLPTPLGTAASGFLSPHAAQTLDDRGGGDRHGMPASGRHHEAVASSHDAPSPDMAWGAGFGILPASVRLALAGGHDLGSFHASPTKPGDLSSARARAPPFDA